VEATRSLSPRQREVLVLYARGYRRGGVAKKLGISPKTVINHLTDIREALGVHTTPRAIVVALARGEIFADGEDVVAVRPLAMDLELVA